MLLVRNGKGTATSTTTTYAFASNVAGNLLVVCARSATAQTIGISDTAGNTWVSAGYYDHASYGRFQMFYAENCIASSSANTVTMTVSSSAALILACMEFSGIAASSSLSAFLSGTGSGTALSSGTMTVTSNDLVIGFGYCSGGLFTAGTGFTRPDSSGNYAWEYGLKPTTSEAAIATATSGTWVMLGAAFHTLSPTYGNPEIPSSWFTAFNLPATGEDPSGGGGNYGWVA